MVVGLGAAALASIAWLLAGGGGDRGHVLFTWFLVPVLDVALFVTARRVCRTPDARKAPRRFWWSMAAAAAIFVVGDAVQAWTTFRDRTVDTLNSGTAQSAVGVLGSIVVVGALLTYPTGAKTRAARLRFAIDAATVLSAAAVVSWCLLTRPALAAAGPTAFAAAMSGFGVLMVGVFLAMRLSWWGRSPISGAAAVALVAASLIQGLTNMIIPVTARGSLLTVHAILIITTCVLLPVSARLQERAAFRASRPLPRAGARRRFSFLPYAATAVVFVVLALTLRNGVLMQGWGALAGLFLNFTLVAARQLLALRENGRLLDRLDDSVEQIRQQSTRMESLLRHSSDITSICDADGVLSYVNPVALQVLGHQPEDMVGVKLAELIHEDDRIELRSRLGVLFDAPGAQISYHARWQHADGSFRWLEVVAVNLLHEPGINGVVSNARDVTEARAAQELLRHQATHDSLTGLANRRLLAERMRECTSTSAAVLLVDLDGFKPINDTYGHAAGDAVLLHVAGLLRACAGVDGLPVRLGGDEFAVLLPDAATADQVAERFQQLLAKPADVAGHAISVGASVGCATGSTADPDELLHQADQQMYERKRLAHLRAS